MPKAHQQCLGHTPGSGSSITPGGDKGPYVVIEIKDEKKKRKSKMGLAHAGRASYLLYYLVGLKYSTFLVV